MEKIIMTFTTNLSVIVKLVVLAVVMDTIFGAGRAIKNHTINSSVGIDGAIRKISMIISLIFLAFIDSLVHINLIGFIPEEIRNCFPQSISSIGLAEFFGLLYLCYEIVSILKNMTLCGLPVKRLWETVYKFLGKYTEELPDTEEQDRQQERTEIVEVAVEDTPEGTLESDPAGNVKIYDDYGNVVGSVTKEQAERIAAAVTKVKLG